MPSLAFEQARLRVGTLGIGALLATAGGFLDGFTYVATDPTGLLPPVESGRLDFLEAMLGGGEDR